MEICEKSKCTGCEMCSNICTKDAIHMEMDSKGFFYPCVNEAVCVGCGKCRHNCPVNNVPKGSNQHKVYAALIKDDSERAKSTSGGIFACLAKNVLNRKGVVFGVILDDSMVVKHIEVNDEKGIDKIRGSKYVQSRLGNTYRQVKIRLDEKRTVLFSGTPCQVAGLKNYLGREYDNLLTVDILCHGVPSPGMFQKYICAEEERANSKMVDMGFRTKTIGWKKIFSSRTFVHGRKADWSDTFVPGFLTDLFLRESCYQCAYANCQRVGDITLGDYWGYREAAPDYIEDDDKGISQVIINTAKGADEFKHIKKYVAFSKRNLEEAISCSITLSRPNAKPSEYDDFWKVAESATWKELCEKYIPQQDTSDWMSREQRDYFEIPFVVRHRRHWIICTKERIKSAIVRRCPFLYRVYRTIRKK